VRAALPGSELAGGAEVVRFVRTLSAASNLDQLKHSFLAGFGRLLGVSVSRSAQKLTTVTSAAHASSGTRGPWTDRGD
jgi:hypothetical protein